MVWATQHRGVYSQFPMDCLAMVIAAGLFLLWAIPANKAANGDFGGYFSGTFSDGRFRLWRATGEISFLSAILSGDYGRGIFPVGDFFAGGIFGKFGKKNRECRSKKYFIELDNCNCCPDDIRGDEAAALHIVCLARDGSDDGRNNCRIRTKCFK